MFGGKNSQRTTPDFSVAADEFINEHVRSKSVAQSKYQGKTIQLTGMVFMVWDSSDNIVSSPYLHIAHSGSRPDHIACCFSSPKAVQQISQGKQATITGRYGGTIKGGVSGSFIVVLKDCTRGGSSEAGAKQSGGNTSGGGSGFAQKVLDADPNLFTGSNVRSYKNVVKDFTPKHPAGTKADAIQAIAMLTPGNPPHFIRHSEGVSSFIGLRCNPALWKAVFGSPKNLREVKGRFTKHHWIIRCSDGDLRCVGDILGNQLLALDVVFKE
ncbi:MAG: hypothetical protein FJ267_13280 [Planctomycetes bacterium]|nr:hypothetical protein [Planctomycetota bacterium]